MAQVCWAVKAQALDRHTNKPIGKPRIEMVGTNNLLFRECKTLEEVKQAYESFWNELNLKSGEIVEVISIKNAKNPFKVSGVWYHRYPTHETIPAGWGFYIRIRGRKVYQDSGFRTKRSAMNQYKQMQHDYFDR